MSNLQETLRIARAIRRFEATVAYDDDREPIGKKVQRWQSLKAPDLPAEAQEVRAHDPAWGDRFAREAVRISEALGAEKVSDLQHIGSSAIPHLGSKPVLDMMVAVHGGVGTPQQIERFAEIGYEYFGNSPCDREADWYWSSKDASCILVAHVCDHENPWQQTAVNFRDYMCAYPDQCTRYENLKKELAADENASLLEYSISKLALFYDISAKADAWRAANGGG